MSKQSYYDYLNNHDKLDGRLYKNRQHLIDRIQFWHKQSQGNFGAWSIYNKLINDDKLNVSMWLVRNIMKELNIHGLIIKKVQTTKQDDNLCERDDLVKQDFTADALFEKLVGDITYLKVKGKTYYLATVIDLYSRMVVGWSLKDNMKTGLIIDALQMAHKNGCVNKNAIFHSDRGSQYTSHAFKEYALSIGVKLSTGRKATCYDNAVAESWFATLKKEMFYQKTIKSFDELYIEIRHFIEGYYNSIRPHSFCDGLTPRDRIEQYFSTKYYDNLTLVA